MRKARMSDVPRIHALINRFAEQGLMLAVSRAELYERLRDFSVMEEEGQVAGTVAVHFIWEDLAELRSLAVAPERRGTGLGRALVEHALAEAREYACRRVFTLTYIPPFFEKLGFARIDKAELPHKVWTDCIKCPKFPDCGEVPLAYEIPREET
ncbi:MAG: N-acetyltransferase [Planctomycetota bacterium]